MRRAAFVCLPRQNSTSGGSSESEVNEFAVMARISPSSSMAITVTPVTNCPTARRNARESNAVSIVSNTQSLRFRSQSFQDHADVVGLHEIGRRPALEVVFRPALLGEALVPLQIGRASGGERG